MRASALKLPATPETIETLLISAPSNRLHYREIRDALPRESSATIIKLLVEMQRQKRIIFDADLRASLLL